PGAAADQGRDEQPLWRSLHLNAGVVDDLAPLDALIGDERAELFRRAPPRDDAKIFEALCRLGLFEFGDQRGIELVDDVLRRARVRKEALPALRFIAGHRFS